MKSRRRGNLFMLSLFVSCIVGMTISAMAQEGEVLKIAFDTKKDSAAASDAAVLHETRDSADAIAPRITIARVGVQTAAPIPLSLDDAIRKALTGNNNIEITRDDVRFHETRIRSLLGFFDPFFPETPPFPFTARTVLSPTPVLISMPA